MFKRLTPKSGSFVFAAFLVSKSAASLVSTINPQERTISSATVTSGNTISLSGLNALISAKNDRTLAGVFDSENVASGGSLAAIDPDYTLAKFTVTGTTRYGRNDGPALSAGATTSGSRFGFINQSETWTLGSRNNEKVTHFGATFSNWGSGVTLLTVRANFSDNTSETFTSTANAGQYSFAGFQAPAGESIVSIVTTESSSGNWLAYDDIAIVLSGASNPPVIIPSYWTDPVTGFHTISWPTTLGETYRVEYTTGGAAWIVSETAWDAQGTETKYINSKPPTEVVEQYRVTKE